MASIMCSVGTSGKEKEGKYIEGRKGKAFSTTLLM
jgi:hypothetical protein